MRLQEVSADRGAVRADVLTLYLRLLPKEFFAQVRKQEKLRRQNNRIYTDAVVIWLMILQQLCEASMEAAVLELLRTLPPEVPAAALQASASQHGGPRPQIVQEHGIVQPSAAGITIDDRGTGVWTGRF